MLILDEARLHLTLHIEDADDPARIQDVFDQTGEVTWGWSSSGGGECKENRAEPHTTHWVGSILFPMGYQADVRVIDQESRGAQNCGDSRRSFGQEISAFAQADRGDCPEE